MKQPKLPTIVELKELWGLQPLSSFSVATKKYKITSKPLLFNGRSIDVYAQKESLAKSAQRLNTSVAVLKRMVKLY